MPGDATDSQGRPKMIHPATHIAFDLTFLATAALAAAGLGEVLIAALTGVF